MANYAQNEVEIRFNKSVDLMKGDEIIKEFDKTFECDDIYSENTDSKNMYSFEASFDSKWSAPLEELTKFCYKHDLQIIGTSKEFSMDYAVGFLLPYDMEKEK